MSNKQRLFEVMCKVDPSFKQKLNEDNPFITNAPEGNTNVYNKYNDNYDTVKEPIIPDAISVISKNPLAVEFHNKAEYDNFANEQRYFSASHSHCFYSIEEMREWSKNGSQYSDPDSEASDILFETGREIVQVWDNKNSIGFIVPAGELRQQRKWKP